MEGILLSLRKLILSHNRIVSLQYFKEIENKSPALENLDLSDNYIGDLQ
jgi:Leucine-rich repeat (LRR) protein